MRIKKEVLNKIISIFASVLLLVNSFTPYSFAQVPTEEPTVTPAQEEITPAPTTEITPAETITPETTIETVIPPTIEVTPAIEETPVETIAPTETPALEATEKESVPSPPVEERDGTDSF